MGCWVLLVVGGALGYYARWAWVESGRDTGR